MSMVCPGKALAWVPGMLPTAIVASEVPRLHQGPSAIDMLIDTTIGMLPDSLAVAQDIAAQLSLPDLIQHNRRLEALLDKMRRVRQVWLVQYLRRNLSAWHADGDPLQTVSTRHQIIIGEIALLGQHATFLAPI